jgi:hypothetical protein
MVHVLGALLASAEEEDAWAAAGLGGGGDDWDSGSDAGSSDAGGGGSGGGGNELAGLAAGLEGFVGDVLERSAAATPVAEDPDDARDPLAGVAMRELARRAVAPLAAQDPGGCGGRRAVALQLHRRHLAAAAPCALKRAPRRASPPTPPPRLPPGRARGHAPGPSQAAGLARGLKRRRSSWADSRCGLWGPLPR